MYGYYADVANDCQLFHVCYPILYPGGGQEMVKWSFICPNQTIFDQVRRIDKKLHSTKGHVTVTGEVTD